MGSVGIHEGALTATDGARLLCAALLFSVFIGFE